MFTNEKLRQLTAHLQKAGFRFPKKVLWLIKHWLFKSSFAVKVPPFGSLQNVSGNAKSGQGFIIKLNYQLI